MGAIVKAAAQGAITPDEALRLNGTSDFDKRLQILENAGAEQSANAVGWYGR